MGMDNKGITNVTCPECAIFFIPTESSVLACSVLC